MKRYLVIVLHAPIERIEALRAQLPQAFVAIALHRGAASVDPYAIEFITGDKLLDVGQLSFHEIFAGQAQ